MSTELLKTDELKVLLGAPDRTVLVFNPKIGRTIDLWKQQTEMNLYLDRNDFIEANENFFEVTINQENDFENGAIQLKNRLKKEIGKPDHVKLFRKINNLYLKPH